MTKRIFKSIFAAVLSVLLASLVLIMWVLYGYFEEQYSAQLENDAVYIAQGVNSDGIKFLENIKDITNRITLIAADGTVLFDNQTGASDLENHSQRKEVREALESGEGRSRRYSNTFSEKITYYALRLDDGSVLRVSNTGYSLLTMLWAILQPLIIVLCVAAVLSSVLAYRLSKTIVKPINELNLEMPDEDQIYEEITPLIQKINRQNQQIATQIAQLKMRQQEFTAITENMSEGMIIIDSEANIISNNTSATRILGSGELRVNTSVFSWNASEGFRHVIEGALSGISVIEIIRIGEKVYQVFSNPVYDSVTRKNRIIGAVIILLDVTEREYQEAMRREFTANVSHELKTPLTSISGFAEIIRNGLAKPEDVAHFAGNIYEEAQRLITLVGDIMRLSQLDEDSMIGVMEQVDLYELAQKVVQTLMPSAESQEVTIHILGEHAFVNGIPQILQEMIFNLIDNAIKYNKKGGRVQIAVNADENGVRFSVSDTGIGIPDADKERVFERFYRVDKSHSKEIGGTGLGLSIVKHGAAYHNAQIKLESQMNQGTTVTMIFHVH